jgi:hypothetical protein
MQGIIATECGCTFYGDNGVQILNIQAESSEIAAGTLMEPSQKGGGNDDTE